ncbi:hypothetical protein OG401_41665 [Kitasatospora purpeofusca]|uniref:hypothetical protein n=1 Tax=Kitasatospora purpeofusca TaxID=67352 RepID=UPI002253F303|nr:hypothetical protein [Kitasatospora purpeofusca]MCX4690731.1 hypothetical protein [Kitasatospora purpeofusca]
MLTITTTARLGALRRRADRAETALTDTARQLEELRDALEQARTGRPVEPELPEGALSEGALLVFRTELGGLVVVTKDPTYDPDHGYAWQCLACGDSSSTYRSWALGDTRAGANAHAAECRAVPAGTAAAKKKEGAR